MRKQNGGNERTSYVRRSDDPKNVDRSQLFWSGVNAVRNVQKSSQCDSYHFIASSESRRRHRDVTDGKDTTPVKWMIYPDDKWKLYWDCISSSAIIYAVAEIPFSIGFLGNVRMSSTIAALDNVLVIVFWIDILITFNSAYHDPKTRIIITDRKKIALRYSRFWLWFDLVSAAPLRQIATYYYTPGWDSDAYSFQLIRLFRLSRLVFVYKLFKSERLSTHLDSINVFPLRKNSCLLFLQIFLTGHVLACFWFFITTRKCTGLQNPIDDSMPILIRTWATEFGLQNASIFSQYIASLYFTFETLFTIGYGDFYATNLGERVYVIIIMLIGSLLFGAIIAQIKDVLDSLNIQKNEAIKKLEEFSEFMEEKRYPLDLRVRAKEAYSYYLDRRPSLAEKGLFDMLPRALKIKVLNLKYRREIMGIDFFQTTDIAFAVKLLSHSRPFSMKYGQCIYGIGDVANELSFLIRGSVRITAPSIVGGGRNRTDVNENIPERNLGGYNTYGYATSGGYFGDFEYTKSGLRTAEYTAGQSCICISVSYLVVSEAIKDCPVAGAIFLAQIKERSALFSSQKARKATIIKPPSKGLTLSPVSSKTNLYSPPPHNETIDSSEHRPRSFTRIRLRSDSFKKSSSSTITEVVWVDGALKSADASELTMIGSEENNRFYIAKEETTKDGRKKEVVVLVESEELKNTGILMPTGQFKMGWDFFIAMITFYSAVTVPLQLVFESFTRGARGKGIINFDLLVAAAFFLDMVASVNTAYYCGKTDAFIVTRRRIVEHYLRTWFLIDLFSCLPFDTIVAATENAQSDNLTALKLVKIIKILRLIRLIKLSETRRRVKAYIDSLQFNSALVGLISTILVTYTATHFLACLWWGLASHISSDPWYESSPHIFADLINSEFAAQYVTTVYLTLCTLTSTGFGDIVPGNTPERCMAIFLFIIGTITYAYVTTTVSNIVRTFNRSIARNDNFTLQIKEYLDSDEISRNLLWEVIGHAKKVLRKTSIFNEGLILERLPSHLRIDNEAFLYFMMYSMKLLLHEHKEVLETLSPLKFIQNNSVKLEILRFMRPNYAEKGRCIIKEGETTGGVVFLISGRAIITKSRVIRKSLTVDTVLPPHVARRRGGIADFSSENGSRKSGIIDLSRRISSSSFRSKYFPSKSNDVIPPRGTLLKLFHSQGPSGNSLSNSNSVFSSKRSIRGGSNKFDTMNRFPSGDERGSEKGGGSVSISNKSYEEKEKGIWKDNNEMESCKTNEESDNNFDNRIYYHKSPQDIESSSVIEGEVEGRRRYSNDTYDGRASASESSQKISPCVSQRSGVHFNQYNDGSVSDKSDHQQQHVYGHGLGHVQEEVQGVGQGEGVSPSPSLIPIPSHSTTQIPRASSSFDDKTPSTHSHSPSHTPNHNLNHSPNHGHTPSDGPISLRTLPSRPPITIRNSSSNFDRDKKLFMGKHSKSVTDFFRKSKSTDPDKLIQVKRGDTSSKIRGIKLPTRSSFFSDVRQYVSSSTDKNEIKHERYSRRNRSGSMDGFEEKAEDVLGVLNSRDFIGYFEMQYSSKHTVSVTAIEACWYYTFDHANVLSLLESNPRVAFELQRALGLAIDEMDAKLLLHEKHQKRTEFLQQIRKKFLQVKMEKSRKYEVFNAFGKKYRYSKLKLDEENGNNLDVSRRSSSDEIPLESWHSGSYNGNRNLNQLELQQKKKAKFFRNQGMLSVNHEVNDALKTDENSALKDNSSSSFNDDNKESKSSHTHTHTKHTQPHTHSHHHLHHNNTSENDKDHLTNIARSSKAYNNDSLTNPIDKERDKERERERERDPDRRRDSTGSVGFTGTRARAKGIISASNDSADERYAYNMKWKLAELDRLEALCTFEEMGEECNRHRSGKGQGQGNGTSSGRGQGNGHSNKDETGSEPEGGSEKGEGERGTETRLGTGTGAGTRRNPVRNEYKRKYTLGLNQNDVNVRPLRRTFRERLRSFRNRRNIPSEDRGQNVFSQDVISQPSPLPSPPLNPSPSLVPTPPLTLRQKFVNRVSLNRLSSDDISPRNSTSNSEMNSNRKLAIFSPNGIAVMEKKSSPLQYEIEAFSKHHRSSTDIFLTKGKTRKLDQNFEIGNKKIRRSLSDL